MIATSPVLQDISSKLHPKTQYSTKVELMITIWKHPEPIISLHIYLIDTQKKKTQNPGWMGAQDKSCKYSTQNPPPPLWVTFLAYSQSQLHYFPHRSKPTFFLVLNFSYSHSTNSLSPSLSDSLTSCKAKAKAKAKKRKRKTNKQWRVSLLVIVPTLAFASSTLIIK